MEPATLECFRDALSEVSIEDKEALKLVIEYNLKEIYGLSKREASTCASFVLEKHIKG